MRLAVPTPASAAADSMPLLIAAFCLLWSSAFAVTKLALQDCPPLLLLVARFLLTAGVMLGAAAARAPWRFSWRDVAIFALLGLVNNALYLGLNVSGMRSISAGLAALISSLNPVLTALLATAFLGEQMTWRKALGLVLGVGGVAVIVEGRIAGGTDASIGVVFSIAALISLVGGTILFKRLAPNGGLWIGNGVQHLAGAFILLPLAISFCWSR